MAASSPIQMSHACVPLVHEVEILDEAGRLKTTFIPGERPLTIYLDKREIVTLMTLGSAPEALVLVIYAISAWWSLLATLRVFRWIGRPIPQQSKPAVVQ